MKKLAKLTIFSLVSLFLLTSGALAWDIILGDSLGQVYFMNYVGYKYGLLKFYGKVAHDGVQDQGCIMYVNPMWGDVMINLLPSDVYCGSTFIGIFDSPFIWCTTCGYVAEDEELYMAIAPNAVPKSDRWKAALR